MTDVPRTDPIALLRANVAVPFEEPHPPDRREADFGARVLRRSDCPTSGSRGGRPLFAIIRKRVTAALSNWPDKRVHR